MRLAAVLLQVTAAAASDCLLAEADLCSQVISLEAKNREDTPSQTPPVNS